MHPMIPMALAGGLLAGAAQATATLPMSAMTLTAAPEVEQLWLAKNDKGKAKGHQKQKLKKGGQGGKPEKAGGKKKAAVAAGKDRPALTEAPAGRDMRPLLAGSALALLGPGVVLSAEPEERLLSYRNCPPGLAKKDPPCVPPGLARKGMGYDEWVSYEASDYDRYWLERRALLLDGITRPAERNWLQADEIAALYGLAPAPAGQRYALIDGLPVLLDEDDYTALLLLREFADIPQLDTGLRVAPTAALTQAELAQLYRLPQLAPGQNYAVLNGEIVALDDDAYEALQLIRIARALF